MKYGVLSLSLALALSGCASSAPPEERLEAIPDLAIKFEPGSYQFNNIPKVREGLESYSGEGLGVVAYASTRSEYDLAYQRFKSILNNLKESGTLFVQTADRGAELNTMFIYASDDWKGKELTTRFTFMPEERYALDTADYRRFQKEALRQYVGVQAGSVYQQLKGLAEFYGWVLRYKGENAPNRELSLSSLELAFIEQEPSPSELKQLLTEVLHQADISHQIRVDAKRRVMEVQIQ